MDSSPRLVQTHGASSADQVEMEEKFEKVLRIEAESNYRIPEEQELTQSELNSLYAKDMNELSMKERDMVYQDVHGIADVVKESPDFVEKKVRELQLQLFGLRGDPRKNTLAYEQALEQNHAFATSGKILLAFLRADRWNPKLAAYRLVRFFETKLSLFGRDLLTQTIQVSHLSKDDKKALETGSFQLLPVRDAAGRAILVGMPMLLQYKEIKNLNRAFFYIAMTALEDVETQRNGVVLVGINVGPKRAVDRTAVWTTQRVRKTLPIRVTGMHYCYDDFKMRPMMSIAMLVMGATSRVRFRAHYGKPEDNQFKLSTFGIPIQALPLTADGGPKVKYHRQWLKSRRDQEELQSSDEIIVIPGRLDVLLGRGKPIQEHYGNQRYHVLLDKYQNAYELAKKFEKMQIADRIVQSVHEYSGHFLRQDGARWVIVDDIMARDKVSHAFRTRRAASGTSAAATSKMPNINLKNIGTKRRTSEESETPGSSLSGTDSKRRVIS